MKWIVSGAACFVLAGAVGTWAVVTFIDILHSGTHPMVTLAPGQQGTFQIPEDGKYLLWNDDRTEPGGEEVDSSGDGPLDLHYVLKDSSGTDVKPVDSTNRALETSSHKKKALVYYQLRKGDYTLIIEPHSKAFVLSLNRSPELFVFIVASFVTVLLGATATVLVMVAVVQAASRKAAATTVET